MAVCRGSSSATPHMIGLHCDDDKDDDDKDMFQEEFLDAESDPEAFCEKGGVSSKPKASRAEWLSVTLGIESVAAEFAWRFPEAPQEEIVRFCTARPKSAAEAIRMYAAYLEWRRGQGRPERLLRAASAVPQKWLRHAGVARDGSVLFIYQGARYDLSVDIEEYVLAIASLIDATLSATDSRKITTLVDVRPGEGWNNVPGHKMVPFFKLLARVLPNNFPERLHRVVIYPMPRLLKHIWYVMRPFLDPNTQDKFQFLFGTCAIGAECPKDLRKFVTLDQLPEDAQSMHAALAADP